MMRPVQAEATFSVAVETKPGEVVCLTGDGITLGDWNPHKAKQLRRDSSVTDREVWRITLKVNQATFSYRYFTCLCVEADHEEEDNDIIVTRWETNIRPRQFSVQEAGETVSTFGEYGGGSRVDKGWLTGQTEVRLRLHSNPIHMWKSRHQQQTYSIKCTPMDLRYKETTIGGADHDDSDEEDDLPHKIIKTVEVSNLTRDEAVEVIDQGEHGVVYEENSYIVFKAQHFEPEFLGFTLDFYVHRDGNCTPKHVGYAYVLPVNFKETLGTKTVPISGLKHRPIGQIRLEYLIVKPLLGISQSMKQTFECHWKYQRRPLDVGHRGMGSSYTAKEMSAIRENSIASLAAAGSHGADMVEFDVQLTKDLVPVVYHDFTVCLTMKKKANPADVQLYRVPVRDLTLTQVQQLKVSHSSHANSDEVVDKHTDDDDIDHQAFPTLRQVFERLDEHIGFNVEIKYPILQMDGCIEENLENYTERNKYLDIIIKDVLQYAGTRRVIFSCFDPDTCIMLRRKQNKYPVLFLTMAMSPKYTPYDDKRTQSVDMAMRFGLSENILGINVHAEELFRNKEYISVCKKKGLVLFCWGEDNNDTSNIKELKRLGVDGVIYDRIHEFKESKDNIFKMEREAKLKLLRDTGQMQDSDSDDSGVYAQVAAGTRPSTKSN